jgi:hypothetical protein
MNEERVEENLKIERRHCQTRIPVQILGIHAVKDVAVADPSLQFRYGYSELQERWWAMVHDDEKSEIEKVVNRLKPARWLSSFGQGTHTSVILPSQSPSALVSVQGTR